MRNRQKQAIVGMAMAFMWGFWLMPTAEDLPDAEPATPLEWKLFIALNFVLIVYVHILNVREHHYQVRIERQKEFWKQLETRSRNNHPTAK
jgi:hypothetical protein